MAEYHLHNSKESEAEFGDCNFENTTSNFVVTSVICIDQIISN